MEVGLKLLDFNKSQNYVNELKKYISRLFFQRSIFRMKKI